ncbi:MAG: hypothetical protein JWP35_1715 [Caulobacter sp.]|nr:hypothetical protein [Caulobacter sp.]
MPQMPSSDPRLQAGADDLTSELAGEQAANLGRMGRGVETALRLLREGDANGVDPEARDTLLRGAADAVWRYFVQREVIGIKDQRGAIAHYGIPKEVLNRVGAR